MGIFIELRKKKQIRKKKPALMGKEQGACSSREGLKPENILVFTRYWLLSTCYNLQLTYKSSFWLWLKTYTFQVKSVLILYDLVMMMMIEDLFWFHTFCQVHSVCTSLKRLFGWKENFLTTLPLLSRRRL